jgi:hypothetical protein
MYRVVSASETGDIAVWRTPAPDTGVALPPGAMQVTPYGTVRVPDAPPASPLEQLPVPKNCQRRKIMHGEVLFFKRDGTYYVVKRQRINAPTVDEDTTPGPALCEVRALETINRLMVSRRVAPVFCEQAFPTETAGGVVSITMAAYITDLSDWIRGDGRDPTRTCVARSPFNAAADAAEPWLYTRYAGHHLATSSFPSDRRLFNDILRATLLQVLVGLAQAQRHCLFTHNDLHAGNVMFEHSPRGISRLLVTGAGTFLLPKRSPNTRIIDFQHASFDEYDGDLLRGRVSGGRDDVHNGFSLVYDVWRLCSNLVLEIVRPYRDVLDGDLANVLCAGASLQLGELPKMADEVHWKPYLLDGPAPEDLLRHPAFDRFRATPTTPADVICFERSPDATAQDRYLRTRVLRHRGALPVPRAEAYARFAVPEHRGGDELLRIFAQNYEGTVMGHATMYHKHTAEARIRYLFIEFSLLHALVQHLWSPACAAEVASRAGSMMKMCALADAIGVVLHADFYYIARPSAMGDYNAEVLAAARLPCVRSVQTAPILGSGLSDADEETLLSGRLDGDIERFRGLFISRVVSSQ